MSAKPRPKRPKKDGPKQRQQPHRAVPGTKHHSKAQKNRIRTGRSR